MTAPLDGIRVLDFSRVLSGPHCTRMLCDLGADVIKVEPPAGDITRFTSPRANSMATYYVQQNTGKRNISLDFKQPEAIEILMQLVDRCDIVVENFRAGVMDRQGLGYEAIHARNPRVIYASISGYGATGPWTQRRAYAPVVGAETGLMKSQGDARWQPGHQNDRHSHADVYTSLETASGILAALYQREQSGIGQWVDVSMAQTMLYVNEHFHDDVWDRETDPNWLRSFRPQDSPVVTLADGSTVVVSGHPAEQGTFQMYARAIERPEIEDDPRFATVGERLEHLDVLFELIREYAATVRDVEAFEEQFGRYQLAVGTLRAVTDIIQTDWAAERNVTVDVSDRADGTFTIPNAPWRFSAAPEVGVHGEPRYRGEDNRAVLSDVLGLSDERIDELAARGVISDRVPTPRSEQ